LKGLGMDPARVPDGGVIDRLSNGLEIIRRRKHEPLSSTADPETTARLSDRRYGSKFLPHWPLERLARWTRQVTEAEGWPFAPGVRRTTTRSFAEPVGLVAGRLVHTIEVVTDGRHVHAYPVEDAR
jgi:hypothetical protein